MLVKSFYVSGFSLLQAGADGVVSAICMLLVRPKLNNSDPMVSIVLRLATVFVFLLIQGYLYLAHNGQIIVQDMWLACYKDQTSWCFFVGQNIEAFVHSLNGFILSVPFLFGSSGVPLSSKS